MISSLQQPDPELPRLLRCLYLFLMANSTKRLRDFQTSEGKYVVKYELGWWTFRWQKLLCDKKRQNRNRKGLVTAFTPCSSPCFHGGPHPPREWWQTLAYPVAPALLFLLPLIPTARVLPDAPSSFSSSPGTASPEDHDGNFSLLLSASATQWLLAPAPLRSFAASLEKGQSPLL